MMNIWRLKLQNQKKWINKLNKDTWIRIFLLLFKLKIYVEQEKFTIINGSFVFNIKNFPTEKRIYYYSEDYLSILLFEIAHIIKKYFIRIILLINVMLFYLNINFVLNKLYFFKEEF